jgi:hypothetical protein
MQEALLHELDTTGIRQCAPTFGTLLLWQQHSQQQDAARQSVTIPKAIKLTPCIGLHWSILD